MATIDITRPHKLGTEGAKEKAEQLAKDMEQKLGIQWSWDGNDIRFKAESGKAKGVKGSVKVSDGDVKVEIDLPLLLRAMKGMIVAKVNEKLEQIMP